MMGGVDKNKFTRTRGAAWQARFSALPTTRLEKPALARL